MMSLQLQVELLLKAGQLLLKYNETTAEIHREIKAAVARISNEEVKASVSHSQISVSMGRCGTSFASTPGIKYNVSIQIGVHEILRELNRDEQTQIKALAQLQEVETSTPRHTLVKMAIVWHAPRARLPHC